MPSGPWRGRYQVPQDLGGSTGLQGRGKFVFIRLDFLEQLQIWGFSGGIVVKNPPTTARDARHVGSIPGSGRSPAVGNGTPLQYSCLENSMGRGAWWATIHGPTDLEKNWEYSTENPPICPCPLFIITSILHYCGTFITINKPIFTHYYKLMSIFHPDFPSIYLMSGSHPEWHIIYIQ